MARRRPRSQQEVIERSRSLAAEVREAVDRLPSRDPSVIDTVWHGEALGTLLWALQLAELPSYDRPFHPAEVAAVDAADGELRDEEELVLEHESARLWLWRARTAVLQAAGSLELPERYSSLDQLIAATAMRGYEHGLLPEPMRGDFRAYGKVYRHLPAEQLAEAHSLAVERQHALGWLVGEGTTWDDVPLDT